MEHPSQPSVIFAFVPLLLISLPIVVVAHLLAKEKGRNVGLWTLLGAIPLVNIACLWFFVGAANLRLEKKVDALLQHIRNGTRGATNSV